MRTSLYSYRSWPRLAEAEAGLRLADAGLRLAEAG